MLAPQRGSRRPWGKNGGTNGRGTGNLDGVRALLRNSTHRGTVNSLYSRPGLRGHRPSVNGWDCLDSSGYGCIRASERSDRTLFAEGARRGLIACVALFRHGREMTERASTRKEEARTTEHHNARGQGKHYYLQSPLYVNTTHSEIELYRGSIFIVLSTLDKEWTVIFR